MTEFQRVIKYLSIGLAVFLAVSIIMGFVGLIGGILFMNNDNVLDEMREIEIAQSIEKIEIDVNAAALTLKVGENFALSTNLEKLTVKSSDGKLVIKEKSNTWFHSTKAGDIVLTIPADATFSSVKINAGAGQIEIENLVADSIDFDFGAGEIEIESLTVKKYADIDTDAGKFTVKGGAINNLDLDLGVGKSSVRSALTGECDIDCGVGETELTVLGNKDDYRIKVSKGIGDATLDGVSVGNDQTVGNGENRLLIDGGIGSINIRFE